jgi:predicted nucleotidyltransferase component of viral defense system
MADAIRNQGASVRARLQTQATQRKQPFQLLLTRYVLERLLYRLSTTAHRDRFVLKGAMLMTTWLSDPFRPTHDLDLLGFGEPSPEGMLDVFREVCAIDIGDGVTFDVAGLSIVRVRDELEYGGLRIKTDAVVDRARIRVVIDIGFGDAIEPGLTELEMPVLLDQPAPRLRAYAQETVIAEKFQAMVILGRANSRMKDLYDIWVLARSFEFTDDRLPRAIAATFERRKTPIPDTLPVGLTQAFIDDPTKQQQWRSFVEDLAVKPGSLAVAVADLAAFLMPQAAAAKQFDTKSIPSVGSQNRM